MAFPSYFRHVMFRFQRNFTGFFPDCYQTGPGSGILPGITHIYHSSMHMLCQQGSLLNWAFLTCNPLPFGSLKHTNFPKHRTAPSLSRQCRGRGRKAGEERHATHFTGLYEHPCNHKRHSGKPNKASCLFVGGLLEGFPLAPRTEGCKIIP